MKTKERTGFCLSDKIDEEAGVETEFILIDDVKEFIRLLKEEIKERERHFIETNIKYLTNSERDILLKHIKTKITDIIDKLAGDKLNENN